MPRRHKGTVPQRIVIGENMKRIRRAAKQIQAEWYQGWKVDPWDAGIVDRRNRRWIIEKMKQGCEIVDIGIDPTRNQRSRFYQMEKQILSDNRYPIVPYDRISRK
jgi:hypothetical protein